MSVAMQLAQLHQRFSEKTIKNTQKQPLIAHDEQWPSPCEIGTADEHDMIQWQAIVRESAGSLADLANALELEFPDELSQFYGHMFAGSILASVDGHQVELLQAWNEDDFDLLQQNITGHVLMKRKLKQAPSVFIGLTDQDDLLVTVLVETGEVCLEYVGKKPHHVLAKNLSEFIALLAV